MSWITLAIISAITGSLTSVLQKVLLRDEQSDAIAFSFIFQTMVGIMFLTYTIATKTFELPNLSSVSLNLVLMTFLYSLGSIFTFNAFKTAEASEVAILFTSSTVWSVLAAVIFLNEKILIYNIFGITLIILGVIIVNHKKSSWKVNKGHYFALAGAMLFGLAFTNDAYIINYYNSISSYMIIAFGFPGIASLLYKPKAINKVKHFLSLKTLIKLTITGALYAISAITIFSAYKNGGQASLIAPIQKTSIILTVFIGYLFLNERKNIFKKIVGVSFVFSGALLLI